MNLTNGKRLVIVGGVAAGASCAARTRRLDESAQITLIERGPETGIWPEEVATAEALVTYSLDCWLRLLEQQPEIEARDYATRLLNWLIKQPGQQSTGRAMLRIGPKPRSAGIRDTALAILEGQRRICALGGDKWGVLG